MKHTNGLQQTLHEGGAMCAITRCMRKMEAWLSSTFHQGEVYRQNAQPTMYALCMCCSLLFVSLCMCLAVCGCLLQGAAPRSWVHQRSGQRSSTYTPRPGMWRAGHVCPMQREQYSGCLSTVKLPMCMALRAWVCAHTHVWTFLWIC